MTEVGKDVMGFEVVHDVAVDNICSRNLQGTEVREMGR